MRDKTLARLEHKCDVCPLLAPPELTEVTVQIIRGRKWLLGISWDDYVRQFP